MVCQALRVLGLALVALLLTLPPTLAEVPVLDSQRGVMTTAPLLEATTPAVVNISVRAKVRGQNNPLLRDPFFRPALRRCALGAG